MGRADKELAIDHDELVEVVELLQLLEGLTDVLLRWRKTQDD